MEYGYEYFGLKMLQGDGVCCKLPGRSGARSQFTLMLWFCVSDCSTIKGLVSQEGGLELSLAYDSLCVSYQEQTGLSEPVVLKNIWNHVAVVLFDSAVEVFLNGASILLKEFPGLTLSEKPLTVGKDFFGYLRSAALYEDALLTDEIQHMMYHEDAAKPALVNCDFTSNPPLERVSGTPLALPSRAQVVCLSPSAVFEDFSCFRCVENTIQPWLVPNSTFTLQAWLNVSPNSSPGYYALLSNLDELFGGGMELGVMKRDSACKLRLYFGSAGAPVLESSLSLQPGLWQNIALVCSRRTLRLYIDGVLDTEKTIEELPKPIGSSRLLIGARSASAGESGCCWYHGSLARLDIWRIALTPAQISEYAGNTPDVLDGLLASWNFFETNVINAVSALPLGRVDFARVLLQERAAAQNTRESPPPVRTLSSPAPPLPEALIHQARKDSGILAFMETDACHPRTVLVTSCAHQGRIYFLCHNRQESYPVTSVPEDTDEVTVWCIELILIIVSGISSYFLSVGLSYSEALSQYIRRNILSDKALESFISLFAETGTVSTATLLSFLKEFICSGKLCSILRMNVNLGFWVVISFVMGFMRRFLSSAAEILIWLGILVSQIYLHTERFPRKKVFGIQLQSLQFCHNTPGKICSINIRKNLSELWSLPEWKSGRADEDNAPAVYRLARFSKNADVLELKASLLSVNNTESPIVYEIRAVGGDPFGTSETQTVACPPGIITHTVFFKFNGAGARFAAHGIERYDLTLSWEFRKPDPATTAAFTRFQLSKHRIYAILDSVNLPWGPAETTRNNNGKPVRIFEPWTDLYEKTVDMVRGAQTSEAAMRRIESGLYNSGKYIYRSDPSISVSESIYPAAFQQYLAYAGRGRLDLNCEDCTVLMIAIANLYGCSLQYAAQARRFRLADPIKLIGETQERLPSMDSQGHGYFDYHFISVEGDLRLNDASRLSCYDPCLMYHGRTDRSLRLAGGVKLSLFPKPGPQQTLPNAESYLECVMDNSDDGLGQYLIAGHCGPLYFYDI